MTWSTIRLELARTRDFPEGSASRSYLLRLPLGDEGLIDAQALRRLPGQATVHRSWPNQADLSGYVVQTPRGWAFSYEIGDTDDEDVFHLESHRFREGEYLTLTEPDGSRLPFRVAGISPV